MGMWSKKRVVPPQSDRVVEIDIGGGKNLKGFVGCFTYGDSNIKWRWWGEDTEFSIGRFCSIVENCQIFLGGNHRVDWVSTFPFGHAYADELGRYEIDGHPKTNGSVTIGNDVWIGANATIMSGVHIGDGAVIAANSHVVKDIGAYEMVGGNPAKTIRARFSSEIVDLLLALQWWALPVAEIRRIVPQLQHSPSVDGLKRLIEETAALRHL